MFKSVPPIHRYVPLTLGQTFGQQTLERIPEPEPITDQQDNVLQYDRVMATKLAIAYAIGLETIYQVRREPMGGAAVDLPCGPGHFSICMSKGLRLDSLVGIDMSQPMIAVATKNACDQGQTQLSFNVGDITRLSAINDRQFDLSTLTDAAHHLQDLGTVQGVMAEMDRITKTDGVVFVMDLVRLKTKELTDKYVKLVARDYHERALSAFYTDFHNSMYAAWTAKEIAKAVPHSSERLWFQLVPRGLPAIQFLIGVPAGQQRLFLRKSLPLGMKESVLPELQIEWQALRQTVKWSRITQLEV